MDVYYSGDMDNLPGILVRKSKDPDGICCILSFENFIKNIDPQDKPVILPFFDLLINRRIDKFSETYRRNTDKKSFIWVKCNAKIGKSAEEGSNFIIIHEMDVTEYKEIEIRLRANHAEAESMRQIAAAISASLNMNETVSRILEETQRVIAYDTGTVQLLHKNELEVIGGVGFSNKNAVMNLKFPYPEEGSLSTKAINSKQPVFSNDVTVDFPRFVQPDPEHPVCSWIGIPLIRYGEVIGLMALDSASRGAYSPHDVKLAEVIAVHVATALENARLHERAYQMAMGDALTKIGSRYRFQIEGRIMVETARRSKQSLSMIMFDIDHFKKVNDTYGHIAGDEVLKKMAEVAAGELRTVDLFARYGGEEFVIILPETESKAALTVFNRINKRIAELSYETVPEAVTVSAGIYSAVPEGSDTLESFVIKADEAMYLSKNNGRNRVTLYK